jgi:hypothetical protein
MRGREIEKGLWDQWVRRFCGVVTAKKVHGTVTVVRLDPGTSIAVFATRMFGETGVTAVLVRPVPAP